LVRKNTASGAVPEEEEVETQPEVVDASSGCEGEGETGVMHNIARHLPGGNDPPVPVLWFGKHKGRTLTSIPTSYLTWLLDAGVKLSGGTRTAVGDELRRRNVEAPPPPPPKPPPTCSRCGCEELLFRWYEHANGVRQIRRTCRRCGLWLGCAPRVPPYTTLADAAASPTPILDVLTRLDDLGVELRSDGRRVWISGTDWHRVPKELHDVIRQCGHTLAGLLGNTMGKGG
jgi:hypothetical protein